MPIDPSSCTLTNGESWQFSRKDANGAVVQNMTWVATPPTGTVRADGLYTAPPVIPAPAQVTVTGTDAAGTSESAFVQLLPPGITITPQRVSLQKGDKQQFVATVTGGDKSNIRWQLSPSIGQWQTVAADPPTIEYEASSNFASDREITLTATADNSVASGSATIGLFSPPGFGVKMALFLYLVVVFWVVAVLILLWPPPTADVARLQTAHDQRVAAWTQYQTATSDEQKAQAAQKEARAALDKTPNDITAKSKAQDSDTQLKKAQDSRGEADKRLADSISNEAKAASEDQYIQTSIGKVSREVDLLWIVLLSGTLGSFVYVARSFVDFVGNKTFRRSWSAWYLMYPLIGAALAMVFYLVFRAGYFSSSSRATDVNVYGISAISAMAGMFSKQATNKLSELFATLFKSDRDDKNLKDKLSKS